MNVKKIFKNVRFMYKRTEYRTFTNRTRDMTQKMNPGSELNSKIYDIRSSDSFRKNNLETIIFEQTAKFK